MLPFLNGTTCTWRNSVDFILPTHVGLTRCTHSFLKKKKKKNLLPRPLCGRHLWSFRRAPKEIFQQLDAGTQSIHARTHVKYRCCALPRDAEFCFILVLSGRVNTFGRNTQTLPQVSASHSWMHAPGVPIPHIGHNEGRERKQVLGVTLVGRCSVKTFPSNTHTYARTHTDKRAQTYTRMHIHIHTHACI